MMKTFDEAMQVYGAKKLTEHFKGLTVDHIDLSTVHVYFDMQREAQIGEHTWSGFDGVEVVVAADLMKAFCHKTGNGHFSFTHDYEVGDHIIFSDSIYNEDLNISALMEEIFECGME